MVLRALSPNFSTNWHVRPLTYIDSREEGMLLQVYLPRDRSVLRDYSDREIPMLATFPHQAVLM